MSLNILKCDNKGHFKVNENDILIREYFNFLDNFKKILIERLETLEKEGLIEEI